MEHSITGEESEAPICIRMDHVISARPDMDNNANTVIELNGGNDYVLMRCSYTNFIEIWKEALNYERSFVN